MKDAVKETILIVEDDAEIIELLNVGIQELGYTTFCALSTIAAFEWLKTNAPLLMVLDYNLPDMNGREFMAGLKARAIVIPPFILAAGQGDERLAVEMMKLGAMDYIVKDKDYLDLLPLVVTSVCKEIENENKLRFAEIYLNEFERFGRQVVESVQEGIIVYDDDLKYVVWNPFMEQLTGTKATDVIGRTTKEVFPFLLEIEVGEKVKSALQGESFSEVEFYFDFPELEKRAWVSCTISPLRNVGNEVIGVISTVRDVTERKNSQAKIQKISRHYQAIIEKSPDGCVLINADARFKYASPSALRMFGYDFAELSLIHPDNVTHPDDLHLVLGHLDRLIKEPDFVPVLEYRFKHKNGSWIWIESTFSNLLFDMDVESIVINFRDITERKKAEELLLESEERYRMLAENTNDVIWKLNLDGIYQYISPSVLQLRGYTVEEVMNQSMDQIVCPTSLPIIYDNFKKSLEEFQRNSTVESEYLQIEQPCKDGSTVWTESSARLILNGQGEPVGYVGVSRNIAERKKAEEALLENQKVLNNLLLASTSFINLDNKTVDYDLINNLILELSGAKYVSLNLFEENGLNFTTVAFSGLKDLQSKMKKYLDFDFVNKKWPHDPIRESKIKDKAIIKFEKLSQLASPTIPATIATLIEKTFNLGDVYVVRIYKSQRSIGDFTLLFTKETTLRNADFVELFASQVGLLIERLLSEKALRKSEEIYRNLVTRIPDGVYESTPDGKFIDVNPAMVKMLGFESKEDILKVDIISDLYFDANDRNVKVINNQNSVMSVFRMKRKDGMGIWIEDHGWYNTDKQGNIISHEGVLRDITERKLAEDALKASEDKYRTMIEYSNDLIWTIDGEGNFKFMNHVGLSTTGLDFDEWKGKSFVPLIMEEDLPMVQDVFFRTMNGEACTYELRFKKQDGVVLTILVNTSPIYVSGKIEGVVSFGRNITDEKLAQQALNEKMNDLIRFHNLTVGRELTMIELKKEVNTLLKQTGNVEKYRIVE